MADVIQLGVSADSSELVAALTEERQELQETESAFERFGNACVSAMQAAGNVTVSVLKSVSGEIHAFAQGALGTFGQEVGKYAGQLVLYGSAVQAKTSVLEVLWNSFRVGLGVAARFAPALRTIAVGLAVATAATWAFRAANDALDGDLLKSVASFEQTSKGWKEYKDAGDEVMDTLRNVGHEILAVGGSAAKIVADVTGVSAAFKALDDVLGSTLSWLAASNREWAEGVQIIVDSTLDWVDAGNQSAASLRAQAAASEALIAKQESQAEMFGQLRKMQEEAATGAVQAAELQRIASLDSVDAVTAEIQALQQKAAAAILAGEATEESQKRTAALFAALENQKNTIANNVTKSAELEKKQQELETQKAINKAKEDAERLEKTAAENIARLKDQIDLATGAATEGEIAIRQMMREGQDRATAEEIGRLTDELNRIREAEKEANKKPEREKIDRTTLRAAAFGSQEAASIVLRGVGGPGNDIPQKQLGVQQQMLLAIKANKPQQLTPLTLGVA